MHKKTTGLVLGKFMPLHQGHELLLQFASAMVDQLFVVVDHPPHEPISGATRVRWVQETAVNAQVFYLADITPQAPAEHPDFWNQWRYLLLDVLPETPDYIIASEPYGFTLAERLGAICIPFDFKRDIIPISATQIREDSSVNWEYLSVAAKRDYRKRVCVFGPESSGKTMLCNQLADYFKTVYVPEYARLLIEAKGTVEESDMLTIARGQIALEASLEHKANGFLFCDTDAIATSIWQRWLFGKENPDINDLANATGADLYLLTEPDLPWIADAVRYLEHDGEAFHLDCMQTLERYNKRYVRISGNGEGRSRAAIDAVISLLSPHEEYSFLK